jgi:preprotein translocase subunit SecA
MVDEAKDIMNKFSALFDIEQVLGNVSVLMATEGEKEDALKRIDENLNRFPKSIFITVKAGDAYRELKEDDKAVELYYKAYGMSETDNDKDAVLERLVPLLSALGRESEARELKAKIAPNIELQRISKPKQTVIYKNIGRNEPCPCQSGKKYKKCCLVKM